MGKGDKKTKRGKIFLGTYGVSRPRKKSKKFTVIQQTVTIKEEKIKKTEKVKREKVGEPEASLVEISENVAKSVETSGQEITHETIEKKTRPKKETIKEKAKKEIDEDSKEKEPVEIKSKGKIENESASKKLKSPRISKESKDITKQEDKS